MYNIYKTIQQMHNEDCCEKRKQLSLEEQSSAQLSRLNLYAILTKADTTQAPNVKLQTTSDPSNKVIYIVICS